MSFFGKTNFDNETTNRVFKPYYSIKDVGENVYRIAPSCRSLVESGNYAAFLRNHFGYKIQDSYNPDKTRAKPFSCIEKINFKTKELLQACPECDWIAEELSSMESEKERLEKEGKSNEYVKQALAPKMAWLKEHNLDKKWYCYAKNRAGEWNILKIGHKVKLALDEIMKRLYKIDGVNALDPASGVWFSFTKNGMKGSAAVTNIEVLKEKTTINGQKVEILVNAPLTEDDVKAIEVLPDIMNLTPKISYDQVKALVASKGDTAAVTSVFSLGQKATTATPAIPVTPPRPAVTAPEIHKATEEKDAIKTTVTARDMTPEEFLRSFAK